MPAPIPVQSIPRVLDELVEVRRRSETDPDVNLAQVSLFLRSSRKLRGAVVNVGIQDGVSMVLLQTADWDLIYVPLDQVEALAIHSIGEVGEHLSSVSGKVDPQRTETAATDAPRAATAPQATALSQTPSRQEAIERLASISLQLSERFRLPIPFEVRWETVPSRSEADIIRLASGVAACLLEISRDQLKLSALKDRIGAVRLQSSVVPLVALDGRVLAVASAFGEHSGDGEGRFALARLKAEIEGLIQ